MLTELLLVQIRANQKFAYAKNVLLCARRFCVALIKKSGLFSNYQDLCVLE
jgi:hypothetical protein